MSEQEVREFEENIVKGANIAFQRLVNQKKKEDGELVFSRNGYIFRVKAADLEKGCFNYYIGYTKGLMNQIHRLFLYPDVSSSKLYNYF